MDQLDYQRKLAEYDEAIAGHKVAIEQLEHDRAKFVLAVLDKTIEARKAMANEKPLEEQPTTIIRGTTDAGRTG